MSIITGFHPDEISITKEEALRGNIKYHYGNLNLVGRTSAIGLQLPETISGHLFLDDLTSTLGLKMPKFIGLSFSLNSLSLTYASGLPLQDVYIGGDVHLDNLTLAIGLQLQNTHIGGDFYFYHLTSTEGLQLDNLSIEGVVSVGGPSSAEIKDLQGKYPNLNILNIFDPDE